MLANLSLSKTLNRKHLYAEEYFKIYSIDQQDHIKIISCNAFRRLEHKTQVFPAEQGDHFRSRLTHSLEVAFISKVISDILCLNWQIAENIALSHDLGHAPFGHSGEDALNEILQSYNEVFNHNLHTIKLLTKLEKIGEDFSGLNLSLELIDGLIKHNGIITEPSNELLALNLTLQIELEKFPSLEAQIAAISDDIAYICHDLEDGFRADLISIEQILALDLLNYLGIADFNNINQIIINLKHELIENLIKNSLEMINKAKVQNYHDVINFSDNLICFSIELQQLIIKTKIFLMANVYLSPLVLKRTQFGQNMIKQLFNYYLENFAALPINWQNKISFYPSKTSLITDFIAGMSDHFLTQKYQQYCNKF